MWKCDKQRAGFKFVRAEGVLTSGAVDERDDRFTWKQSDSASATVSVALSPPHDRATVRKQTLSRPFQGWLACSSSTSILKKKKTKIKLGKNSYIHK